MGGTLDAQSELGHGSVFTLRIPLGIPAGSPLGQPPRDRHAGKRVLVVEDQELNCMILEAWLEKQGFVVEAVEDGDTARERLESHRYDLVLLDLQIPGMTGMDLLRWMKSRADLAEVPVVAVTASVRDEDRVACLEAGMAGFVPKPLSVAKLDAVIQAALDGR
jgi:CheY-like chemotaxis protein